MRSRASSCCGDRSAEVNACLLATDKQGLTGKAIFPADMLEMLQHDWVFRTTKAEEELGWRPHTVLAGMTETWMEYQATNVLHAQEKKVVFP